MVWGELFGACVHMGFFCVLPRGVSECSDAAADQHACTRVDPTGRPMHVIMVPDACPTRPAARHTL